jgi:hypothetical protein
VNLVLSLRGSKRPVSRLRVEKPQKLRGSDGGGVHDGDMPAPVAKETWDRIYKLFGWPQTSVGAAVLTVR